MELAWKQHDRAGRQESHQQPVAVVQRLLEHLVDFWRFADCQDQIDRSLIEKICHPDTDGDKRDELDNRLGGDGQHQAFLVLCRVDVPGAECPAENRHADRDYQRNVIDCRIEELVRRNERADHRCDRNRDRFELQGNVRNDADDSDQGRERGYRLALSIARTDEIGDRCDALGL